jgi:hypothetical protein
VAAAACAAWLSKNEFFWKYGRLPPKYSIVIREGMGKYGKISRKKLGLGFMLQKWRFSRNIKPTMYEDITGINAVHVSPNNWIMLKMQTCEKPMCSKMGISCTMWNQQLLILTSCNWQNSSSMRTNILFYPKMMESPEPCRLLTYSPKLAIGH